MNDELELTPAMIQRQQEIKDFLLSYAHPSDVPTYWQKPDQTTAAIIWELLVRDFRIKLRFFRDVGTRPAFRWALHR